MKFTDKYRYLALMAGAVVTLAATEAAAQTKTVTVSVDVQNTMTLVVVNNLNFGKIIAISNAAKTASLLLNSDTGAATIATTGAPALIATVDATNRKVAQITIANFADGATINVTIQNVTAPVNGAVTFTLGSFTTSFNGGADSAQVVGVAATPTVTSVFNGGVNTLDIGAKITTNAAGTPYVDGNYPGSFDVVFSY